MASQPGIVFSVVPLLKRNKKKHFPKHFPYFNNPYIQYIQYIQQLHETVWITGSLLVTTKPEDLNITVVLIWESKSILTK